MKILRVIALLLLLAVAGAASVVGGLYWKSRRDPLVSLAEGSAKTLIRNVRVIDVVTGTATAARDVLIENGEIRSIKAHDPRGEASKDVQILDGAGLSLIPGLVDVHCHIESAPEPPWLAGFPNASVNLESLLFSGVTTVFDPGGMAPNVFELRETVRSGEQLGPNIYLAGPIFTGVGGHPEPMIRELTPGLFVEHVIEHMTRQISSPAQAAKEINALMPLKPDFIKVAIDRIPLNAPKLSAELAVAVVDAAKKAGLRTVAHIGTTQDALDAGNAGVAAWVHGVYKERISEDALEKLVRFGIPMAPTLVVFDSYSYLGLGPYPSTPLERQVALPALLEGRVKRPDDFPISKASAELVAVLIQQREDALSNVRRLAERGVVIMAGSDAQAGVIHGPALHRELALLARAGLSPLQVLRAATLYPARFLSNQEDPPFGVIAPGKRADLVLVREDPLKNIAAVSEIEKVILGGRVLQRHPLAGSAGP